jgi:polysaccharide pyruvyl transferase WcaK-like protein
MWWATSSAPGPRLRLGLSGYYGFGNYGDELFRQAFAQGFAGHELALLHDLPRRPYYLSDKAAKVAAVDAIVIGGGDLVIPGYWTDFYFEEEWLARPVFIHGVGVPRWTGGEAPVIRRLRAFFQHPNVRHINVRDAESKAWVEKHLAPAVPVELSPDLVWGVGFEAERAGARKGPPGKPVFGLITRRQGVDPKAYDALAGLLRDAQSRGYHTRLIVAGTGLVGEEDLDDARRVNLPADELAVGETVEDVTEAILGCDVLASMKFHGCIVGNANRIPTFALLTTDKFVNFYRAAGIEDRLVFYGDARAQKLLEKGVPPPLSEAVVARERDGALAAMARLRAKLEAAVAGRPG